MTIEEVKKSIVEAGKNLVNSGLISRTWGNISCRIDKDTMAITPSGMDYNLLTPEDIVVVKLSDLSHSGTRKPSVEKGIHAAVYELHPEVNFVIHTHQVNASVVGALGLRNIKIEGDYPLLNGEVLCAKYALPGSKRLCGNVSECVKIAKGNAVIMVNHGALCFGKDQKEAFNTASQLEEACNEFVKRYYLNISGEVAFDENKMRRFALQGTYGDYAKKPVGKALQYDSVRTESGFRLLRDSEEIAVATDKLNANMPEDAKIHSDIYKKHKDINYIKFTSEPNTREVSGVGISLRPLLDDFAQIAGTNMKTAERDASQIISGLKNESAVFILNEGALCVGNMKGDAQAVAMILEKTCKTLVGAALFNHVKPLNRLDCFLMRLNYKINYSKAVKRSK
jgi:L-fuculose-phosphate aldolase